MWFICRELIRADFRIFPAVQSSIHGIIAGKSWSFEEKWWSYRVSPEIHDNDYTLSSLSDINIIFDISEVYKMSFLMQFVCREYGFLRHLHRLQSCREEKVGWNWGKFITPLIASSFELSQLRQFSHCFNFHLTFHDRFCVIQSRDSIYTNHFWSSGLATLGSGVPTWLYIQTDLLTL